MVVFITVLQILKNAVKYLEDNPKILSEIIGKVLKIKIPKRLGMSTTNEDLINHEDEDASDSNIPD